VEFRVLGPLEVRAGEDAKGRGVEVRRGLPRTLLAALVLRAGETVSAGALIDILWGDDLPRNPSNALQIQVSYLRKQLGGSVPKQPIVTRPGGYALDVAPEQIDAHRFERAVRRASRSPGGNREQMLGTLQELEDALALWRGEAFADVSGEAFAIGEAARLQELRLVAIELRNGLLLSLGQHHELVGELSRLTSEQPLRERFQEQLLVALYRSGRQADALRAYERARSHLIEELGVEPGPALRELERRILAQDPELTWTPSADDVPEVRGEASRAASPAMTPEPAGPGTRASAMVPVAVTPLVGRAIELSRIEQLLGRGRIVTLTGPAGAGKSRLALEAAGAHAESGDVWFVDLASADDRDLVAATVAAALAIPIVPGEDAVAAVAASLSTRKGLLVLDTCEHVVSAVALLVGRILRQARDVRVLATSRRPLGITGEVAWPVPPLALAPPTAATADAVAGYPAVQLFVERAAAVRPDFELTDANAGDVAAICLALDGLPLAIELAAARADVLAPQAIRARLMNRFELLVDGSADVAARQQTLRAALDWSAELLSEDQRQFFARLGVAAGAFDLEAATAIACTPMEQSLGVLRSLVRHSMVALVGDDRYRLLDTLRAYALERLDDLDADATRDRHAYYHVELAERAECGIQGPDQLAWLERLRGCVFDHRAALEWLVSTGDGSRAARLAGALGWFWTLDGMLAEACSRLDQVLAFEDLPPAERGKAVWSRALLAASLGELGRAKELAEESVDLGRRSGDQVVVGCGLNALAVTQWALGDLDESARTRDQALAAFEASGHQWGVALCHVLRARTAIDQANPASSSLADTGLQAARVTGDLHLVGMGLEQVTRLALHEGRVDDAVRHAAEAVAVQQQIGYTEGVIAALHLSGQSALAAGDIGGARAHHEQALRLAVAIDHAAAMCEALEGLADVEAAERHADRAAELLALAETHRQRRSLPRRPDEEQWIRRLGDRLGGAAPRSAVSPTQSLEDAVLEVLQSGS
jgi:predicted ATPase/DNA-binding SARP family transcriptional activator